MQASPVYPVRAANWVVHVWTIAGVARTVWLVPTRPEKPADVERVHVIDETVPPQRRSAVEAA